MGDRNFGGTFPDQAKISFGLQADRPSFGQDGEIYIADDARAIYFWDGDNWLDIWTGYQGMTYALQMSGNKIKGLARPASDQEAATKKYVDDVVASGTADDNVYGLIRYQAPQPSGPVDEQVWIDSDNDKFYVYDGDTSRWKKIAAPDHGKLNGLSDDDHSLYFSKNGSKDLTGSVSRDSLESDFMKMTGLENAAGNRFTSLIRTERVAGDTVEVRSAWDDPLVLRNITDATDLLSVNQDGVLTTLSKIVSGGNVETAGDILPDGVIDGNYNSTTRLILPTGTDKYAS